MIFVTGGTGLVGRHLLLELRAHGFATAALIRTGSAAPALQALGAVPIIGSVEDPATWSRVGDCQAIVHAAALIAADADWDTYRRVNVDSVRLAAQRARALGIPLIHLSSVAVYSRAEGREPVAGSIDESFPTGPSTHGGFYARSKRLAETALWDAVAGGLRGLALRPCVIYGEGDRHFLPRLIAVARRWGLPLVGRGDRPLALVHARNVARAAAQALRLDRGWGRAYNVVNQDQISARELAALVGAGLDRVVRTVRLPERPVAWLAGMLEGLLRLTREERRLLRVKSAIRFWRGERPYSGEAAKRELAWCSCVSHRDGLPAAVRSVAAGLH